MCFLRISNQFFRQTGFEEVLTCTAAQGTAPRSLSTTCSRGGSISEAPRRGARPPRPRQPLCEHIWAVLLLLYFLIYHIFSIFQKFIKINSLRMSLPDLRTAINVLPLVLLNFISMGFVEEEIYLCSPCHLEPEASLPPPQSPSHSLLSATSLIFICPISARLFPFTFP